MLFSFFNVIWFNIYLQAWKRYCAELAYKWGTLDQRDELLLEPRPLFTVCIFFLDFFQFSKRGFEIDYMFIDSGPFRSKSCNRSIRTSVPFVEKEYISISR